MKQSYFTHKPMNRAEFVKELAPRVELTQKKVNEILGELFDVIQERVAAGESVDFMGFGSFIPVESKAREGINPQTMEKISINAKLVPKFKPGKSFKDLVAGVK